MRELRRRRVFRTAALYVVGTWLLLQVADVLFPGFGIPDGAIRVLVWSAVLGFPVALVFGWFFDVTSTGIRRTPPLRPDGAVPSQSLSRSDYLLLAAFAIVTIMLAASAVREVRRVPADRSEVNRAAAPKLQHSVAVLPFDNMSSDPENEYFCDGVAEEVLLALAQFRGLNVIGRTSSFAFKGSQYRVPQISSLLGVHYVLQGSVRKQGDQVRIAAQLLDENGVQVWSERYDRRLSNVFEIQSEIADAVAGKVATRVTSHTAAGHTPPVDAYDLYLHGKSLLHDRETDRAAELLQRAVDIDSEFAEARAELAIATLLAGPDPDLTRARGEIDRALELQPGLLRAQAAEALWFLARQPADAVAAERILREVLAQDPNMSEALLWLYSALTGQQRDDEAYTILQRAARIDPLHPSIVENLAHAMLTRGQIDEAVAYVRSMRDLPGVGGEATFRLGRMLRSLGRYSDLNEHARFMVQHAHPTGYPLLAHSYRLLGNWPAAQHWFERSADALTEYPAAPYLESVRRPGDEASALEAFRRILATSGHSLEDQPRGVRLWYGALLARSGDYAAAIELLGANIEPGGDSEYEVALRELDAQHALAWAYLQTDAKAQAQRLLVPIAQQCTSLEEARRDYATEYLHYCAENALLQGDRDLALGILESAVSVGWREYYVREHDPYWTTLADDPRYRALMARVKADVDRQRAEVDRLDAQEDFAAVLDPARKTERADLSSRD